MPTPAELELAAARVNLCLRAERQLLARNDQRRRLPVTIVTGFLGAGKTSLLQHILQHKLNLRVACAVSDLAAVNVDALLVANKQTGRCNKLFQLTADTGNRTVTALKDVVWQLLNDDNGNIIASAHPRMGDNNGAHNSDNHDKAGDLSHVDYLVMETSGTTDPTQLIAAVREKFGKMTRARLDSVVVVVDGDAVAQDAGKGVQPCAVAIQQLQCADVVLLNKVDLLDEANLEAARQVVALYAPNAQVYETTYARVFLPHVLDIEVPEIAFNGSVSHENVPVQWNLKTGEALNGTGTAGSRRLRVERPSDLASKNDDAVGTQRMSFESVVFESLVPIPLAAVHNWLQQHRPKGMLRAKGVMYIAELPQYRFVLQISGKQRLDVVNTGVWHSTPKTQFVVIGCNGVSDRFDKKQAGEHLELCFSRSLDEMENENKQTRAQCLAKLQADHRFETLLIPDQPTIVAFRLSCPTSTVDGAMLRHHHHIDMNELTKHLLRDVNASGGGSLLLCASKLSPDDAEKVFAVASTIGLASVLSMWDEISLRAELIIHEVKKKLATCLCGF
uniref:CobW C-terminal domain-containing protein n=1 Tax=Peronospora matthiolae TaxID=2874970 RepID=A0AAV1V9A0_9STRA